MTKTYTKNGQNTSENGQIPLKNGQNISENDQTAPKNGQNTSENDQISPENIVINFLKIERFINEHTEQIFKKLEECDQNVIDAIRNKQIEESQDFVMFMCQAFPIISSIIQIGTTLSNLNQATDKVRDKLDNVDAVSVIAALTFVYIVEEKAWKEFKNSDKKTQWERIRNRVKKLGNNSSDKT